MSRSLQSRATVSAARKPGQFFREVVLELKKVKWPTKEDVWQMTVVVLTAIIVVGIYVAVLDFIFTRLFSAIGMYS